MISYNGNRYPYLVTAAASTPAEPIFEVGPSVSLDDFDMDMDVDPPDLPTIKYLAIDTNILIDHLHLIRQLYLILQTLHPSSCHLLIPTAVMNELDGLKLSQAPAGTTPDGDVTLGDLAKAATRWLLDATQSQRSNRSSVTRCQRWNERLDSSCTKGDDKILDCCLFFKQKTDVVLWTNDKNLSLLAESNDIPVIGYHGLRLDSILIALDIEVPIATLDDVRSTQPPTFILTSQPENDEDAMDLDDRYVHRSSTPPPSSINHFRSDPFKTPLTPSPPTSPNLAHMSSITPSTRSRIPIPTNPTFIPQDIIDRLITALKPAIERLRPAASTSTSITTPSTTSTTTSIMITTTTTVRLLTTFRSALLDLEAQSDRSDDIRFPLLRAIDALRTIITFLDPTDSGRRPRIGEVADAVDNLKDMLYEIGLVDARQDLGSISIAIRNV